MLMQVSSKVLKQKLQISTIFYIVKTAYCARRAKRLVAGALLLLANKMS